MESKGKLVRVRPAYDRGKGFYVETWVERLGDEIQDLQNKELNITLKEWSDEKTHNQRRYVWEILTQIAEKRKTYAYEVYEEFLRDNPIFYQDKNGYETVYLKKGKEPRSGRNKHWLWLQDVEVQDPQTKKIVVLSVYSRIIGMSKFNKKQMAQFIDNVCFVAEQDGITTVPPDEWERMEKLVS